MGRDGKRGRAGRERQGRSRKRGIKVKEGRECRKGEGEEGIFS